MQNCKFILHIQNQYNYVKYKYVTDTKEMSLSGFGDPTVDVPLVGQVFQDTVIGQR